MTIMKNGYADIRVEHDDGSRIVEITEIVSSADLSGSIGEAYRELSLSLKNTLDGRSRRIKFENGDKIRFYNHNEELFRGRIFKFDVNDGGDESITAYDNNVYLTKNVIDQRFTNIKASDIIRRVSREFGITTGNVDDTGYVIPKLVSESDTIYDVFIKALTMTNKQNGRSFHITNKNGRLELNERKKQVKRDVLESGVNVLSASYSQSIEDLRNRLIMKGGEDDEFKEVRVNQQLIDKFGLMQAIEDYSGDDATSSEVKQAADKEFEKLTTIDDEAKISCLGINGISSGTAVYVLEGMTGIKGGYFVTADKHSFSNGMHEMDITLSATDDLPKLEVEGGG